MSKLVSKADILFTTAVRAPYNIKRRWISILGTERTAALSEFELAMFAVFQMSQSLIISKCFFKEFRRRILSRSIIIQVFRHRLNYQYQGITYKRCKEYQTLLHKDWLNGDAEFPIKFIDKLADRLIVDEIDSIDVTKLLLITNFQPICMEHAATFRSILGGSSQDINKL